eukprot:1467902-Amphidinium_carterae.1
MGRAAPQHLAAMRPKCKRVQSSVPTESIERTDVGIHEEHPVCVWRVAVRCPILLAKKLVQNINMETLLLSDCSIHKSQAACGKQTSMSSRAFEICGSRETMPFQVPHAGIVLQTLLVPHLAEAIFT